MYLQAYTSAYVDILYFLALLCAACALIIFVGLRRSILPAE